MIIVFTCLAGKGRRNMAIGIPGVDEKIFLDLFDNDMELFVTVLRTFIDKTPAALNNLDNVSKETLSAYAICVHGVKGACANICAEEARQTALRLETKAKAGDLPGVLAENETFLKYMKNLMNDLQNWLKNYQK
jgi:HPt (histidine-containing phosphotransfer) domain-containing protein